MTDYGTTAPTGAKRARRPLWPSEHAPPKRAPKPTSRQMIGQRPHVGERDEIHDGWDSQGPK